MLRQRVHSRIRAPERKSAILFFYGVFKEGGRRDSRFSTVDGRDSWKICSDSSSPTFNAHEGGASWRSAARCGVVGYAGVDRRERAFRIALGVTARGAAPPERDAPPPAIQAPASPAGEPVACIESRATLLKSMRMSRERGACASDADRAVVTGPGHPLSDYHQGRRARARRRRSPCRLFGGRVGRALGGVASAHIPSLALWTVPERCGGLRSASSPPHGRITKPRAELAGAGGPRSPDPVPPLDIGTVWSDTGT